MTALVTGGAGFIGSHLVEALCARGMGVTALDNLSLGAAENLASVKGDLTVLSGDIRDRALLRKAVAGKDLVFHLAALPSVAYSVEHPEETDEINLRSTLALLSECREARVKRVIFSSSSAVYGDSGKVARETDAVNPLSPYALQKYAAEQYVLLFSSLRGTQGVALRYFNVFGPRQSFSSPYSGVIARFCSALLAGDHPTVYGSGEQSRDLISVHDVVRANLLAAAVESAAGRVFNIGTGVSTSVLELLRLLKQISNASIEPRLKPGRIGEIKYSCADISLAREYLGFVPQVGLADGLKDTLEFYRRSDPRNGAAKS